MAFGEVSSKRPASDTVETLRPSAEWVLNETEDDRPTEICPSQEREPVRPLLALEDDRPTEIYAPRERPTVHTSRIQQIKGSTVLEMIRNPEHHLSAPLQELVQRARADLPGACVDLRTLLRLRHDFEFDRRVGYHLTLAMFDRRGRCIEVRAEVDPDGRALRRWSIISNLVSI